MTKELDEDITAGEGAYAELNGEPEPTQDESSSAEAETRPDGMPRTPHTRGTLFVDAQLARGDDRSRGTRHERQF
ncbi:hypothetical protein NQZ68_005649 [Dissostichus eleginoides]|nr:hypothetical protein NQZ68_005649 [Dissostichus eleginoides]